MGWVVPLFDEIFVSTQGWWRYATTTGSLEENYEISEGSNLASVDYGVAYPIVAVTLFMDLTKYWVKTKMKLLGYDYYAV